MDIIQMYYFINIVECSCNLSLAAKKIHISQSALSQFVKNFEENESIQLFHRKNGRLDGLTEAGERIYRYSTEIVSKYEEMQNAIQSESAKQKGTIRLGLPSLILRFYFSNILPNFLLKHPHIDIQIIESGGVDLRQKLLAEELNYALLIEPTSLDTKKYEQHIIQMDEYVAFMDKNHPLANKELMEWKDLEAYQLGTFIKSFTTYGLIEEKLKKEKITAKLVHLSSSWDYLVESTYGTDIISILPAPIENLLDHERFKVVRFRDFIPFNIWFCRPYKARTNDVENFVYEEFLKLFYMPVSD
ncbi:LysR family transcriptional regulator [Streptococcus minor]|uniref:LysR family transcriptional regulator n=1 Tax=Streptococcus minor TaxID=229549 RepID=A0A3P1VF27_9STRE|nr:LysR family transcriptional regulator [Streptococcus minor]MDO5079599.1 LysR family transcriptional regulator [Streptococcus minor]RRD32358.1 LysR family transcriptional regulator [Streptococcus minor]